MTVTIKDVYSGNTKTYEGDPDVIRQQLLATYPWLARDPYNPRYSASSFQDVVGRLGRSQAFQLSVR